MYLNTLGGCIQHLIYEYIFQIAWNFKFISDRTKLILPTSPELKDISNIQDQSLWI